MKSQSGIVFFDAKKLVKSQESSGFLIDFSSFMPVSFSFQPLSEIFQNIHEINKGILRSL